MKNKLDDLVDHLFAQVERLGDESLDPETIKAEIGRAGALEKLSSRILDAGRLSLEASVFVAEHGGRPGRPPALLGLGQSTDND